jgi:secernin
MCDTLVALPPITDQGVTLFAKNSDRPSDERQLLERHDPMRERGSVSCTHIDIPTTAEPTIGAWLSRPAWCWGAEMGVNDAGVAIGNEAIYTADDPRISETALIGMDFVRLGLQRATTAAAAVEVMTELLERFGQGGACSERGDSYWSSFIVADSSSAFVLETSRRQWQCQQIAESEAISNRTILLPGHPNQPTAELVDPRRDAGLAVLAQRPVSIDALQAHLASHVGGPDGWTVCMHHDTPGEEESTTAAMVAALLPGAPPQVWWCEGSPCTGAFCVV